MAAPRVSVAVPRVTLPPVVPPPLRESIVLLKFVRFRTAPETLERVTAEFDPKALVDPACRAPAVTTVGPV